LAATQSSEAIVSRWFEAFNHRDLEGMLAQFDPEIEFQPLRFPGIAHSYSGHDGICCWFETVVEASHLHRIDAHEFSRTDDDRVLASGSVNLATVGGIAPFSGLYSIESDLIVAVVHYFTPADVLDRLGMID